MPWRYSNVRPPASPECPWCHTTQGISPAGPEHRYACQQCSTTFTAQWEPDSRGAVSPELLPQGHPDAVREDDWR